jgi:cytochrome P450
VFDPRRDRRKLPPDLSFGFGIHRCIGANLALVECEVAVATLYVRLPNLRVAPGFSPKPHLAPLIVRSWSAMPMEFDASKREVDDPRAPIDTRA